MAKADFPSNNKQPPRQAEPKARPDKGLEQIVEGHAKKKPLGRQFLETFVGGDLKTTASYVVSDVAIPQIKDLLADITTQGIERLIFGHARAPRRRPIVGPVRPGPMPGRINYQGYSSAAPTTPGAPMLPQRQRPQAAPEVGDFQEIVIPNRRMAETVLERMSDVLDQHGSVAVADLYALVGMRSAHTDNNWGWTDLKGSHVTMNRGDGYLLVLPDPTAF